MREDLGQCWDLNCLDLFDSIQRMISSLRDGTTGSVGIVFQFSRFSTDLLSDDCTEN